jgi:hypothetical protein
MTATTKTPDELASDVGSLCRAYFSGVGPSVLALKEFMGGLDEELDNINIPAFVGLIVQVGKGSICRLGRHARVTEYMCIKLCSMLRMLTQGASYRPVESPRYIDTLFNNLNMALYTVESDALCATTSAYEVFLGTTGRPPLLEVCGNFILSEEYFIIEPKRMETIKLILDVMSDLILRGNATLVLNGCEPVNNGLISFLSTRTAMRAFYTGGNVVEWLLRQESTRLREPTSVAQPTPQ